MGIRAMAVFGWLACVGPGCVSGGTGGSSSRRAAVKSPDVQRPVSRAEQKTTAARPLAASARPLAPSARPVARHVPGTLIADTPENRRVVSVVEKYRQAMMIGNVDALIALVHPNYYDPAGTVQTHDDYDYKKIVIAIRSRIKRVKAVQYRIQIRKIRWVSGKRVELDVSIQASFKMPLPRGRSRVFQRTDLVRMILVDLKGRWLFVRGM